MSDEKRKHARTQGRYDTKKQTQDGSDYFKKEGKRSKVYDSSSKSSQECDSHGKSKSKDEFHFSALEKAVIPDEIKEPGLRVLSETENGVSSIFFKPDFIDPESSDELFNILLDTTDWISKKIVIDGRKIEQPRLVAWFGPLPYSYSGLTLQPREFTDVILKIKRDVEHALRQKDICVEFNSVLMNLYRNEKDSVAWHSDDEISMGICPTIASVSLGESRRFELRPKSEDKFAAAKYVVHLDNGSLIVMDGVMQTDWQHRVPKEFHARRERINLTFRTVYPIDSDSKMLSQPVDTGGRFVISPHRNIETFSYAEENFPALINAPQPPCNNSSPKISNISMRDAPSPLSNEDYPALIKEPQPRRNKSSPKISNISMRDAPSPLSIEDYPALIKEPQPLRQKSSPKISNIPERDASSPLSISSGYSNDNSSEISEGKERRNSKGDNNMCPRSENNLSKNIDDKPDKSSIYDYSHKNIPQRELCVKKGEKKSPFPRRRFPNSVKEEQSAQRDSNYDGNQQYFDRAQSKDQVKNPESSSTQHENKQFDRLKGKQNSQRHFDSAKESFDHKDKMINSGRHSPLQERQEYSEDMKNSIRNPAKCDHLKEERSSQRKSYKNENQEYFDDRKEMRKSERQSPQQECQEYCEDMKNSERNSSQYGKQKRLKGKQISQRNANRNDNQEYVDDRKDKRNPERHSPQQESQEYSADMKNSAKYESQKHDRLKRKQNSHRNANRNEYQDNFDDSKEIRNTERQSPQQEIQEYGADMKISEKNSRKHENQKHDRLNEKQNSYRNENKNSFDDRREMRYSEKQAYSAGAKENRNQQRDSQYYKKPDNSLRKDEGQNFQRGSFRQKEQGFYGKQGEEQNSVKTPYQMEEEEEVWDIESIESTDRYNNIVNQEHKQDDEKVDKYRDTVNQEECKEDNENIKHIENIDSYSDAVNQEECEHDNEKNENIENGKNMKETLKDDRCKLFEGSENATNHNIEPELEIESVENNVDSSNAHSFEDNSNSFLNVYSSVEFDSNYREQCTRLNEIYGYIVKCRDEIPFTFRDDAEVNVLFTVINESGGPLKFKVLKAIADRLTTIVHYAEKRFYTENYENPRRNAENYEHSRRYAENYEHPRRYQQTRYGPKTYHNQHNYY